MRVESIQNVHMDKREIELAIKREIKRKFELADLQIPELGDIQIKWDVREDECHISLDAKVSSKKDMREL